MIGIFETITIDGTEIFRPNDFEVQREDVYSGEYTTLTGKTIADCVGWKYSDITMKWDILTDEMLDALLSISGETTLQFEDSDGQHTETIIRKGFTNAPTRTTGPNGNVIWSGIEMAVSFINAHPIDEE